MSGIADRVHVFKEGQYWWIESPNGRAFCIPGTADMRTVQAEAMTLHDHPDVIHMLSSLWMSWCPICSRQKRRTCPSQ